MVVRDKGDRTQIAVLEDGILVEHYVTRQSASTMVGNVYLGKVQNVLPSMEAAFVDIGRGRNAVLYAGEVNWDATGLEGRARSIEQALKSGESVLVQVTKDPIGHKGARLTSHVALSGRHLVYVPNGHASGHLPQAARRRAAAPARRAQEPGARRRRGHRADGGRGRGRGRPGPRRQAAAGPVGGHPEEGAPTATRPRCSPPSPTWSSGSSGTCSTRTSARWSSRARTRTSRSRPTWRTCRRTWCRACAGTPARPTRSPSGASTSRSSRASTARSTCPPAATW